MCFRQLPYHPKTRTKSSSEASSDADSHNLVERGAAADVVADVAGAGDDSSRRRVMLF